MSDENELPSILEYSEDVAEADAPVPLPGSEYEAVIKGAMPKLGVASGKKYVAVDFHIGTDQFPADYPVENNPDGATITYRRVSGEDSPRGRFSMRKFCEAVGHKGGKRVDCLEFVGLNAKVKTVITRYEGQDREEIVAVTAID